MRENMEILGVRVDNFSRDEIKEKISGYLDGPAEQKFVATLNPEIILKARNDKNYREIINSSDLNVCDGFGIKLVSGLKGEKIKTRFTGVELADYLMRKAKNDGLKVLAVIPQNSLSAPQEIKEKAKKRYDYGIAAEYYSGQEFWDEGAAGEAEIILVSFGAPEQEKFIFGNKNKFHKAKVLVGVGGTLDFLTGKMKRAPKFMRSVGLEWLWRLAQEPKRIKRIVRAVFVFPAAVLLSKKNAGEVAAENNFPGD